MDFDLDPLDRDRARAEARSRLFSGTRPLTVGRYVLTRRLGAGSWGAVYEARDPLAGRTVAVKIMHRSADPNRLDAWRTEARLLASLQHPNLIEIYDVGSHDGRGFFVTEWVPEGRTLADWSRRCSPSDEELARRSVGLADALGVLHERGVLHRDIKPENILVDARGVFRLADFGLAVDTRTGIDGGTQGTPAFMPPEVRTGDPASPSSDVYGLCASLWFASTGQLPFQGSVSRRLRRVLRRALESGRRRDARWLASALEEAASASSAWPTFVTTTLMAGVALTAVVVALPSGDRHAISPNVGSELYARGAFSRAAEVARASWPVAPDPRSEIQAAIALGRARRAATQPAASLHIFESAFFRASATRHADLALDAALHRLEVAVDLGALWDARVWEAESAAWLDRAPHDPDATARVSIAIARRLLLEGHARESLAALPSDLDDVTARTGADLYFQRGRALNRLGRTQEGLIAFERAAGIASGLPSGHPLQRSAVWNLAAARFEVGDFEAAGVAFVELLDEQVDGAPLPTLEVVELRRNLGAVRLRLGDTAGAVRHTKLALAAGEASLGAEHPTMLEVRQNLASVLHANGQTDEAIETGWAALVATETKFGADNAALVGPLINLGVMMMDGGDFDGAKAMLVRAETIGRMEHGGDSLGVADAQTNLAMLAWHEGEVDDARVFAERALDTYARTVGANHPNVATVSLVLARIEVAAERFDEARAHAERARAVAPPGSSERKSAMALLREVPP